MKKLLAVLILFTPLYAQAENEYSNTSAYVSIAAEARAFLNGAPYASQNDGNNVSIVIEPEIIYEFDSGNDDITFVPFFRFDNNDKERQHADIRKLFWHHISDKWELNAGISKVFWGVAESNHLVDIINQTDAVEGADGEDKLGQPMVSLTLDRDWGNITFYALPYFRERTYPGNNGRLRSAFPVDTDNPVYESSLKQRHLDAAVRFEKVIGDWDIGISHFSGTSREPVLKSGIDSNGNTVLIPHYQLIDQTGIDIQYTTDAWLWKFEGITRGGQGDRFSAYVAGLEYTFFDLGEGGFDIGLVTEYSRDYRTVDAPSAFLDDDMFFAFRYAANNIADTQVLGGVIVDMNTKFKVYSLESSQRFGDNWNAELEMRFYEKPTDNIERGLDSDDFILLRVARYF